MFLDARANYLAIATSYRAIDQNGKVLYTKVKPATGDDNRWMLRFRQCIEHPSVCFRAAAQDGTPLRYEPEFMVGQDYEFFTRLSQFGKIGTLEEVLFSYRFHGRNITKTRRPELKKNHRMFAERQLAWDLPEDVAEGLAPVLDLYLGDRLPNGPLVQNAFAGMAAMLAHDRTERPQSNVWAKRQSAGVLADGILGRGKFRQRPWAIIPFVVYGWWLIPALFARVLEIRNLLPKGLDSRRSP